MVKTMTTKQKIDNLIAVAREQKRHAVTSRDVNNIMAMTIKNIKDILAEDGRDAAVTRSGNQIQVSYVDYDEWYRV